MDIAFLILGAFGLMGCGNVIWHLLTDDDAGEQFEIVGYGQAITCRHPDIGQNDGECECGERVEIGGSE